MLRCALLRQSMSLKRGCTAQLPPSTKRLRGGAAAACGNEGEGLVLLTYDALVPASLQQRYKRFLGDVEFDSGAAATTIHVPNTGPMTGTCLADALNSPRLLNSPRPTPCSRTWCSSFAGLLDSLPSPVMLSVSSNAARKYAHTLEWIQPSPGRDAAWIGTHSAKANAMVRALLDAKALPELLPIDSIKPEVKYGAEKSRIDFLLERAEGTSCYVEVKSVTLAEDIAAGGGERIALFPDTVSVRAQRHVRELTQIVEKGGEAAMVFLVQRGDCVAFAPCFTKDSAYFELVAAAAAAGVKILAVACELDHEGARVVYKGALPVRLDYKGSNVFV